MVRYLVAAVVCCLYVSVSILIVQREGQVYRASLKTKPLASEVNITAPSPTRATDEVGPSVASKKINTPRLETPISKPAPPPEPAEDQPSPAPPPARLAEAEHVTTRPTHKAAQNLAGKGAPVHPFAKDAFWNLPQLTRAWDLASFKLEDERRLRDELHELIVSFNPLVKDPGLWIGRLEDAAKPLLPRLRRNKEIKYNFYVLDSDVVNAFAIPGGNVYVSRGLFDMIAEDEDYALQFAIGHEMAHVDLEHAIKCLRDPDVMKMTEGTLVKLFLLILPLGYMQEPVDQEFEADDWIATKMLGLQRSRREVLAFPHKLERYAKKNGFYAGRIKPRPGHDLSPVENHYRAQTSIRQRLNHLNEFMDQAANAAK